MCSVLAFFVLCAVATNDAFAREITRPKRHYYEYEDGWDWAWGYFDVEGENLVITSNSSILYSLSVVVATPEVKYPDGLENNPSYPNTYISTEIPLVAPETTISTTTRTNTPETTSTVTPLTSSIETTITESTTKISIPSIPTLLEAKIVNPSAELATKVTNIEIPITTEAISTDEVPVTVTIPTQIKNERLAAIRMANSTDLPIDSKTETTTESKPTETTTKVRDICDPLPEKPDFSAPGRRINEAQCMGYVWELKNRIKQYDWNRACLPQFSVIHVVGGRKVEIGEFPHMGAIGWKAAVGTWVFKCGGTLISANFVLTAAHCTKGSERDSSIADLVPKIVRLGDRNIVDTKTFFISPTDANITNIIVHPQYHAPTQYYDIALMELEKPVEFTRFIQPACLWNSFSTGEPNHEANVTGWGVIESGSRDISPQLMAGTVNVLDTAQCDVLLRDAHNRNWKGFQDHQLCAGKLAGGVDSCQGDSGGPLQIKMPLPNEITELEGNMHYVIGIISFGVGCASPNLPGVYTRVSSFIDWIEDNVWKNGHNLTYVKPPPSNIISADSFPQSFSIVRG